MKPDKIAPIPGDGIGLAITEAARGTRLKESRT